MAVPAGAAVPPVLPVVGNPYPLGLLASSVTAFTGRENVNRYFDALTLRAQLDLWDEQTTLRIFVYRLSGEALKFYKSNTDHATLNYAGLRDAFITRFKKQVIAGSTLTRLLRSFQKIDESVAEFATRVRSLGASLFDEDLATAQVDQIPGLKLKTETLVLNQFTTGLRASWLKDLTPAFLRADNLNIDRAVQMAQQHEYTLELFKQRTHFNQVNVLDDDDDEDQIRSPSTRNRSNEARIHSRDSQPPRVVQNRQPRGNFQNFNRPSNNQNNFYSRNYSQDRGYQYAPRNRFQPPAPSQGYQRYPQNQPRSAFNPMAQRGNQNYPPPRGYNYRNANGQRPYNNDNSHAPAPRFNDSNRNGSNQGRPNNDPPRRENSNNYNRPAQNNATTNQATAPLN